MSSSSSTGVAQAIIPAKENSSEPVTIQESRQPNRRPTSLTFVASPSNSPKANSFDKEKVQINSIPQILDPQPPSNHDAELEEKERWAYKMGFPKWLILRKAAKSAYSVISLKVGQS